MPSVGALNVVTACAASGAPASSAIAASAIGDLVNFILLPPLFWEMDCVAGLEHEPCHRIHYKGNQQVNYKT